MDAEQFENLTGDPPEQDDLERVNCKDIGKIGHQNCGWCDEHESPRFVCSCKVMIVKRREAIK